MKLIDSWRMDKTQFSTASLHDESDEAEFWRTQPPEARLAAGELLRQIAYGYDPTERLPRLLTSVKRENG